MIQPSSKLYLLGLLVASLHLLLLGSGAWAQPRENSEYCRADGRIAILLVDITTPYDQTDKDTIVRMTDQILTSIKGGEKLVVRTIADSHTRSERLIERCIPFCPAAGVFGRLFNCSDGIIRTDHERVRAEVISSLRQRLSTFQELPHSDIIRTIFSVAKEDATPEHPITLYVYSDLIENSDYLPTKLLFSHSTRRLMYGLTSHFHLIAALKDAEVFVSGVGRAGTLDRRPLKVAELQKLTEFWQAYFKECGAKSINIAQNSI